VDKLAHPPLLQVQEIVTLLSVIIDAQALIAWKGTLYGEIYYGEKFAPTMTRLKLRTVTVASSIISSVLRIIKMKNHFGAALVTLAILCATANTAHAGEPGTADSTVDSDWSFGLQAAPLIFGLSVRYHVSDAWQLQGIVQPSGDELSFAARAIRTSTQKKFWRSYLFAGYAHSDDDDFNPSEETAVTAGLGVEWSWAARNPSLPPLSWSLELGLGYGAQEFELDFDDTEDEFFLALGASIHYHFE